MYKLTYQRNILITGEIQALILRSIKPKIPELQKVLSFHELEN